MQRNEKRFKKIKQLMKFKIYLPFLFSSEFSDTKNFLKCFMLPVQLTMPSPVYPILHWQENDPSVLEQLARGLQVEEFSHSLISR